MQIARRADISRALGRDFQSHINMFVLIFKPQAASAPRFLIKALQYTPYYSEEKLDFHYYILIQLAFPLGNWETGVKTQVCIHLDSSDR